MNARRLIVGWVTASALFGCAEQGVHTVPVPGDPQALHAWLRDGAYRSWESESQVWVTDSGTGARVYINDRLADSLSDDEALHPRGAAAVRELFEADLRTSRGWAALVKLDGDDLEAGGDAWLWFEVFDPSADALPSVARRGAPGCLGCHAAAVDFVQSHMPLR